jgi:shikimate kinase
MDEPRNIVSAMANGVGAAVEVEVLLRSDIFVLDGRVHVVVVDEVMGPRRVSSRIC